MSLKNLLNWKAAGIDGITNFFIKRITSLRVHLARLIRAICINGEAIKHGSIEVSLTRFLNTLVAAGTHVVPWRAQRFVSDEIAYLLYAADGQRPIIQRQNHISAYFYWCVCVLFYI